MEDNYKLFNTLCDFFGIEDRDNIYRMYIDITVDKIPCIRIDRWITKGSQRELRIDEYKVKQDCLVSNWGLKCKFFM